MRSVLPFRSAVAVLVLAALIACTPRTPPVAAPPPTATPQPAAPSVPSAPALPSREPEVRVGLLVDTASVEIFSSSGMTLGEPGSGLVQARAREGERWVAAADPAGTVRVRSAAGEAIAATAGSVVIQPLQGGALTVGGKSYRGSVLVRPASPGRVTAVNLVDIEDYLLGVVPHEIGKVGPELLEAAKAQAVAARTYAITYRGRREAQGFDFFATVQDQVYGGSGSETDVTNRAVRETAGEILTYAGKPIEAFYHSTCAGRTAAIEEVWNDAPRPYLVSVIDADPRTGEAYDRSSSRFRWTERWTADELTATLARTLADSLPDGVRSVGELSDIRVTERTASGRVRALRIRTTTAEFTVGGDRVRWILRTPKGAILNSSKFDIAAVRAPDGRILEFVAEGGGWGHGIGMCQVGAMGRARAGQSYRTILETYYPATRLRELY